MNEIWKDIPWYDNYKVSNLWRFINNKTKIVKNPSLKSNWYVCIRLCNKWVAKSFNAHRIVAKAFLLNPDNKWYINHKNNDRSDNRVENLEWVTSSENQIKSYIKWRYKRWEKKQVYSTSEVKVAMKDIFL